MIITRAEWGATGKLGHATAGAKAYAFDHHSFMPRVAAGSDEAREIEVVRSIDKAHQSRFGLGPGYSFLIAPSGRIYEGQGWGRVGAHTRNRNSQGYGFCALIDGTEDDVTDTLVGAMVWIATEGIRLGHLVQDVQRLPHSAVVATLCPGQKIIERLTPHGLQSQACTGNSCNRIGAARTQPTLREGKGGVHGSHVEKMAIRYLQAFLGMLPSHVTGYFGPETRRHVERFQREYGLVADGIVGPKTWGVILR